MNKNNKVGDVELNDNAQEQSNPLNSTENLLNVENTGIGCCGGFLVFMSILLMIVTFPFCLFLAVKVVTQYERAVILRMGILRSTKPVGPGVFMVLPCTDRFVKVDLRTINYDIPSQQMLTSDSVTISVDAVMFYKVFNPIYSVIRVENVDASTWLISQTTLRNIVGSVTLSDLMMKREEIAEKARKIMDEATDNWGISIERLEIKDVRLPERLQSAMAAEAEASRMAKAKIILAKGEQDAAESLRNAAEIISQSPAAIQLKYLQALSTMEKASTIVFPLPIDLMQSFMKK